jgi:hypothetical protein
MPDWLRRAMAARPDATRRPVQGDSRGAIPTIGPARGMRGVPVPRGEAQGVGTPAGSVPVLDAAARDPRQTALDVLSSIPGAEIPVSAGAATARAVSGDPVGTAAYMAAALPLVAAAPARKAVSFLDEIDLGGQKIARYKTPAGDAWITYSQDGEVLDIINAGASTGENSLGARAVIQIRDDLAKRTGAKKMRGWRVSGAGPFRDAEIDLVRPATDSMPAFVRKGIEAWHGSPHNFDKFDLSAPKTTGGGKLNEYGVSLAPERNVAEKYAKDFSGGEGTLYRVNADVTKPLNLTSQEFHQLEKIVGKLDTQQPLTELEEIGLDMMLERAGVQRGTAHPIDAIKAAGYDAITKDSGRYGVAEAEHVIFDPERISILDRSRIGSSDAYSAFKQRPSPETLQNLSDQELQKAFNDISALENQFGDALAYSNDPENIRSAIGPWGTVSRALDALAVERDARHLASDPSLIDAVSITPHTSEMIVRRAEEIAKKRQGNNRKLNASR